MRGRCGLQSPSEACNGGDHDVHGLHHLNEGHCGVEEAQVANTQAYSVKQGGGHEALHIEVYGNVLVSIWHDPGLPLAGQEAQTAEGDVAAAHVHSRECDRVREATPGKHELVVDDEHDAEGHPRAHDDYRFTELHNLGGRIWRPLCRLFLAFSLRRGLVATGSEGASDHEARQEAAAKDDFEHRDLSMCLPVVLVMVLQPLVGGQVVGLLFGQLWRAYRILQSRRGWICYDRLQRNPKPIAALGLSKHKLSGQSLLFLQPAGKESRRDERDQEATAGMRHPHHYPVV
mmetsp:Transcript_86475/g.201208  ORF Transcript_86475/g.201208 Transcript_86475/m.201208 type:complete len:288 (-) Transcript_86475:26-889(-)